MPKLTPEEVKEHRRISQLKYRAAHGVRVGTPAGRPRQNSGFITTTRQIGDVISTTTEEQEPFIPTSTIHLNKDSKIEDIIQWCMELAESLRYCPSPAAWASALQNTLKIVQILDSRLPPPIVEPKPRPRKAIIIEDDEYDN